MDPSDIKLRDPDCSYFQMAAGLVAILRSIWQRTIFSANAKMECIHCTDTRKKGHTDKPKPPSRLSQLGLCPRRSP